MSKKLPDIIVANLHRRFTGVSATVAALVPVQQKTEDIGVLDEGDLGLPNTLHIRRILIHGWSKPTQGKWRIWHARRDVEMLLGLFLRYILRQPWKLVFTSAAPKRHGNFLMSIINRMDAIISTSPRAAEFLDWHTTVVTHGVDTELFVPVADKTALHKKLKLPAKYNIGVFGRIRASKGTDLFVDALLEVLPDFPDFGAFITGECKSSDDEYLAEMKAKIAAAGLDDRIIFLGDVDMEQVRWLYQATSLCVAASRREGFGLTPLEAMASGTAVLTSKAGYWPWLVKAGETGQLFETGDAADLASALREMLSDPERLVQMGKNGREHMVESHSIQTEVAGIQAVYEALR